MTNLPFHRPARRVGPELPTGQMDLQQPPDLPEPQPVGMKVLTTALPTAMMTGGMLMMFIPNGGRGVSLIPMSLMGAGTAAMVGGQMMSMNLDRKFQAGGDRRDYLRMLAQSRLRIRRAGDQQRQALAWVHPDPASLWSVAMTTRLWERRPSHKDFGEVRLGTGSQRLALRIAPPQTKPVEDLDPVSAMALRRFIKAYSTLADQPVAMYLAGFGQIQLDGEREHVLGLVRSLLAQLAVFHGPDDVRVAVCAGTLAAPDWDWVKWLPHNQHPTEADAAGQVRMVHDSMDGLERLLGEDFTARSRFDPSATPSRDEPLLVIVNDGGQLSSRSRLLGMGYSNTVLLDLDGVGIQPDVPRLRLAVDGERIENLVTDRTGRVTRSGIARPDGLSLTKVTALARLMARYETGGAGAETRPDESFTVERDLPALLGVPDVFDFDPRRHWAGRGQADHLRVPIGTGADGSPLVLDLKESAQDGMGPHGLLIGATGSGKSELLRTLVLALAMTHSSETLNLVLVDFKGGATFVGLDELPHVSAVITNLADEVTLVGRMRDAIQGELVRRQELLRAAGNFSSRRDYEAARMRGAVLDPLPTLFVVVDEFSELISAHPDFIELFVMIGRLGRSLGVHLLLASQRLDEGRISQLEGHLSYRIGLRTFSAMESRSVIGVPDAYELPGAPGNGYLRSDVSTIVRFRAAYVSGPARRRTERVRQEVVATQVALFRTDLTVDQPAADQTAADRPPTDRPAADRPADDVTTDARTAGPPPDVAAILDGVPAVAGTGTAEEGAVGTSVLEVLVQRMVGQGPPAHDVWLPPLSAPPALDQLLPTLLPDPDLGLRPIDRAREQRLTVPLGFVDKPFEQARDLLTVNLSGTGGHVGIAGGPQSGKSTLVRSLICALALTHTPREVQILCLDFGGGSLAALAGLPHVGGVTGRLNPDRVNRTVAEMTALLADRERRFGELGIEGMPAYQAMGAAGRLAADENTADVFLVVDGWSTIRQDFDAADAAIRQLIVRGLNFGVHVVIAANRWADVHFSMRDQIGTRLELRLGDPVDSMIDIRAAATVPHQAGRGMTADRLHFLAALPRIDGSSRVDDLPDGTRALVEAVDECWDGPRAMAVRTLPAVLPVADLPAPEGAVRIALGIDEDRLQPVWHHFAEIPHLTVLGDTESGKTNLLRLVLRGVTARMDARAARILVVDWRRDLFEEVPAEQRIGYAVSAETTAAAVAEAVAGLQGRVPGPDITPERLRRRDWWKGPELFVVIDDFDLLAGHGGPLLPLVPFLPQAADIGLHVVLARAAAGSMRTGSDPFLRRLQDLNTPDVALSCPRTEGPLLGGVRARDLPPGRAQLCTRRNHRLIQTGFAPVEHPAPRVEDHA